MDSLSREKEIFSKLIKDLRTSRNLTQREFAKLFSPRVSYQAIGQWERGEAIPARKYWQTLAELAEMELGEFYEYVGVGSTSTSSLLEDIILKIKSLTPSELKVVSQVTVEQSSLIGASSSRINAQHLALLKKGAKAWNKWRHRNPDIIPQLSGLDLNQEDCRDLSGYNLDDANLADVRGIAVSFRGASLVRADLGGANFRETRFVEANLREANLEGADLRDLNFGRAELKSANLQEASIKYSWLGETNLDEADLRKANFYEANLTGANLRKANLSEVNLNRSDLREANLNEATLEKATVINCSIYGVSVWGTKLNGAKLENLYISPDGREGLPIDNLALAQITYWHRHDSSLSQKFRQVCHLEEKAIELANILVDKYGEYSHTHDYQIYINIDANTKSQTLPQYQVLKRDNSFYVQIIPNFRESNYVLSGEGQSRVILKVTDDRTESCLLPSDVENLEKIVQLEEKSQRERVAFVAPIIAQFLKIKKTKKISGNQYILEQIDEEIVLTTNSQNQVELMRARLHEGQWQILNSSLSDKNFQDFQKLKPTIEQQETFQPQKPIQSDLKLTQKI